MTRSRSLGFLSAFSLSVALLATPCAAQFEDLAFPLQVRSRTVERIELELPDGALADLAEFDSVRLLGVPLPGGQVDVELERIAIDTRRFEFALDGAPLSDPLAGLELSVWSGHVRSAPADEVMLAFSIVGCRGWIRRGAELFHLACGASATGGWDAPLMVLTSEATLRRIGAQPPPLCRARELTPQSSSGAATPSTPASGAPGSASSSASLAPTLLEARVAIETDYQLLQVFGGNVAAQVSYLTSLLTWISYRYEEQIQTVLTYPYVGLYSTPADPWSTPDSVGSTVDMLFEFQGAWTGALPAGAHLGAFISGAPLGGGVAWLPGLCNAPFNFSVSANISAGVSFPVSVNSGNWDFMVVAHELGHNFSAPHTHDYCPTPTDDCAPPGLSGACQSTQTCTNTGSIMSYCHLCPGGMANFTTYFHPLSVADMRAWASNACLPLYCGSPSTYCTAKVNSQGCSPSIDYSGHPTLSGLDNFVVSASAMINNKNGLFFFGFAPAAAPFQGGTFCVQTPTIRTGLQNSGGTPGADNCSGTYSFAFTHAYAASRNLTAGTTCYMQCWQRDPASPIPTGLTNALQFALCN